MEAEITVNTKAIVTLYILITTSGFQQDPCDSVGN